VAKAGEDVDAAFGVLLELLLASADTLGSIYALPAAAAALGLDVKAITAQVRDAVKAERAAAKKSAGSTKKASGSKKKAGKKKGTKKADRKMADGADAHDEASS